MSITTLLPWNRGCLEKKGRSQYKVQLIYIKYFLNGIIIIDLPFPPSPCISSLNEERENHHFRHEIVAAIFHVEGKKKKEKSLYIVQLMSKNCLSTEQSLFL
jgi:hypothetical protein